MKKIRLCPMSVLTFSFLLSGNILYGLYYSCGNPVVCYICVSLFLLLFVSATSKWFEVNESISEKSYSKFISAAIAFFSVFPMALTVFVYAESLGTFADYYAKAFVTVFAVLAVILSGICTAKKGRVAVCGFAYMTVLVMLVWVLVGFLGFFHTKNIVPLDSPIDGIADTDFMEIAKSAVLVSLDTVFLLAIFADNKNETEKKKQMKQLLCGVICYIAVGGINLFKNLFLFGSRFSEELNNPDLAAIRLIPMFELPEISVIVNTFALTLRLSVYLCGIIYMLKDAFGKGYKTENAVISLFFTVSAVALAFIYIIKDRDLAEVFGVTGLAAALLFVTAFFSNKKKSETCD